MGKDKERKNEAPGNAFSRMNYLYQAAHLMTGNSIPDSLSRYYIKTMKEISKKVVEKLHPDLKRTLCNACNYPLTGTANEINVKVKPCRKKSRKKSKRVIKTNQKSLKIKTELSSSTRKYSKSRVETRNMRPNKISWLCNKCGFSKNFSQKPSYKLWIHEVQDNLQCSKM